MIQTPGHSSPCVCGEKAKRQRGWRPGKMFKAIVRKHFKRWVTLLVWHPSLPLLPGTLKNSCLIFDADQCDQIGRFAATWATFDHIHSGPNWVILGSTSAFLLTKVAWLNEVSGVATHLAIFGPLVQKLGHFFAQKVWSHWRCLFFSQTFPL